MLNQTVRKLFFGASAVCAFVQAFGAEAQPPVSISNSVVWKFPTGLQVTAAPVVADGVVYCGSMNGLFFALDAGTGQQSWKFSAPFPITSRAAVAGDVVCFECANTLYGLDRKSGQEKWHYVARPFRPIISMDTTDYHHSAPVVAGGVAYFGDDWGNLNGVDVATGALAFQFTTPTGRPIRATPAVKDGVVYFGDWEGEVYAVSLADKGIRWQYSLENRRNYYGAVVSEFVVQDGLVCFGSQHDSFAPLDIATGKPVWTYTDPNRTYLPSTPLIHERRVIIGTTIHANAVYCLDKGAVVWSFKADGIFFTKPVLHGSTLIINSTKFGQIGHLYLLDIGTGKAVNTVDIVKASPSSPAIDNDKLFMGAGDGCIYALDLRALLTPPASSAP